MPSVQRWHPPTPVKQYHHQQQRTVAVLTCFFFFSFFFCSIIMRKGACVVRSVINTGACRPLLRFQHVVDSLRLVLHFGESHCAVLSGTWAAGPVAHFTKNDFEGVEFYESTFLHLLHHFTMVLAYSIISLPHPSIRRAPTGYCRFGVGVQCGEDCGEISTLLARVAVQKRENGFAFERTHRRKQNATRWVLFSLLLHLRCSSDPF